MASRPSRTLPAAAPPQHVPLDALLARAGAIAQPHTARPSHLPSPSPRVSPHADTTPLSVILPVTILHCTCGATIRHPAAYVLVRYAENAHTFHYHKTGPDAVRPDIFATIPHDRRETHVNVPYCESCF